MVKILYLEDEVTLADLLTELFKVIGWELKSTKSIPDALKWFQEQEFDGVLLDIMMPPADGMDPEQLDYGRETGIEIARRMHNLKPGVPIIAFTVLRDAKTRSKILQAGAVDIINKPAEFEQIRSRLQQVIRHN